MSKRSHESEFEANKKSTSLITALRANRMTPSGYQKVDVVDTLFYALRTSQVEMAATCCRELDCDDVWASLFSFCIRESPNALASVLQRNIIFQNNRPYNQILAARELSSALVDICSTEHDTEPFCSLLLSSCIISLLPFLSAHDDAAFVQLRDMFVFGDKWPIEPTDVLAHFWTSFQAMDVPQCAIATLAIFKLQERGMECDLPDMRQTTYAHVGKVVCHWLNARVSKPMVRYITKNPIYYLYVLISACMSQTSFKVAHGVCKEQHEAAHNLLLAFIDNMVLPRNKLDPVQTCVSVCCAIFNIFKGIPSPLSTPLSCSLVIMHEWTDDVQEVVQRRTLTVHRQHRHLRPLEQSVPELANALTPSQINMSHDLAQKYNNLIFFDEMVGHAVETQEVCRAIYLRTTLTTSYTFDVRKPYAITRFLLSDLGDGIAELYSKFT